MKTYLFDTLNRFRRFSENLDVKATLCNKPWLVFNDSGEKELYIFQEDGTLLVTYSGRVTHSTWQYIAANQSIVISAGQQSYMVHPAFMDNVLFALQLDGTNECAFLIDENNAQGFVPRSYTALIGYFEEKERRLIEEERRKKRAQRQKELELEEQRRRLEEKRKHGLVGMKYDRIVGFNFWHVLVSVLVFSFSFFPVLYLTLERIIYGRMGLIVLVLLLLVYVIFPEVLYPALFPKYYLKKYIKKHPDDSDLQDLVNWHNCHNSDVKYGWQRFSQEELHELLHGK